MKLLTQTIPNGDERFSWSLSYAVENPSETVSAEMTSVLLQAGAVVDLRRSDLNHATPLMIAAALNYAKTVRILLNGTNNTGSSVNTRDGFGGNENTALLYVLEGKVNPASGEIVQMLIHSGAHVNEINDEDKTTPLLAASKQQFPDSIFEILIKAGAGATVNDHDKDYSTALMYAAQFSTSPKVIHLLLEAGAKTDLADRESRTAYDYATDLRSKDLPQWSEGILALLSTHK